jgi:hypothetical protein
MSLFSATPAAPVAVPAVIGTLLEVNPPAGRVATITQWSVEFSGISATDIPVIVEVCEVTAASAAGTAITPNSMRDGQVAVASAAKSLPATEGTVVVLERHNVPPSTGIVIQYPLGREPQVQGAAAAAKGFSIRANRGAGAAINATVTIEFDE